MLTRLDPGVRASLRGRWNGLDGVDRVVFDDEAREVCLVAVKDADPMAIERAAVQIAHEAGLGPADVKVIVVSAFGEGGSRRRMRFEGVSSERRPDGTVHVRVELEWCGKTFTGEALADGQGVVELRATAEATLAALDASVGEPLALRLAGIKDVRAFDTVLLMVSLWRPGPPSQRYVGGVHMGDDPRRAVALAVLNALNRMLGNYIFIEDRQCIESS